MGGGRAPLEGGRSRPLRVAGQAERPYVGVWPTSLQVAWQAPEWALGCARLGLGQLATSGPETAHRGQSNVIENEALVGVSSFNYPLIFKQPTSTGASSKGSGAACLG